MPLSPPKLRLFLGRLSRSWTLFLLVGVAAGLVVGLAVAPVAFQGTGSSGTVAVVPLAGGIDGATAANVSGALQEARSDPSVEAVVIVSNSPGGSAAASETLYLEVARTAEQMPVVASVDAMAASGAYYTVAPADHVYAKPSSLVGSVGVYTTLPEDPQPIDRVVASGPKKLSAGSERDWAYKTESLRRAFVGAVFESRGDRLTISRSELSKANLYTGAGAVEAGLVDDIGGRHEAVREAARRAGLDSYDVRVVRPGGESTFVSRTNYVASSAPNKRLVSPEYFVGNLARDPTVPTVVMLPPSVVASAAGEEAVPGDGTNATTPVEPTATPETDGSQGGDP